MNVNDSYQLPLIDECIDSLGEARIFSTLHTFNGYWPIDIAKEDGQKTSFVWLSSTFQYLRMPFGLTNAHKTFQSALDLIPSKYEWKTYIVYMDDIMIFSNDIEEHLYHVDEIIATLGEARVSVDLKKRRFFSDSVD